MSKTRPSMPCKAARLSKPSMALLPAVTPDSVQESLSKPIHSAVSTNKRKPETRGASHVSSVKDRDRVCNRIASILHDSRESESRESESSFSRTIFLAILIGIEDQKSRSRSSIFSSTGIPLHPCPLRIPQSTVYSALPLFLDSPLHHSPALHTHTPDFSWQRTTQTTEPDVCHTGIGSLGLKEEVGTKVAPLDVETSTVSGSIVPTQLQPQQQASAPSMPGVDGMASGLLCKNWTVMIRV